MQVIIDAIFQQTDYPASAELYSAIEYSILQLPVKQQLILQDRYKKKLSIKVIASNHQLSETWVRRQLNYALLDLRYQHDERFRMEVLRRRKLTKAFNLVCIVMNIFFFCQVI